MSHPLSVLICSLCLLLGLPALAQDLQTSATEPDASLRVGDSALSYRVAIDGAIAVVSTVQDDSDAEVYGLVSVYRRNATSGAWTSQATLSSSVSGGLFGSSVSVSGDSIVMGAPGENGFAGSAYVFTRDTTTGAWSREARLTATGRAELDFFGGSVACSGNTVVVGAWGVDGDEDLTGAAYVFKRDPDSGKWSQTQKLTASDGAGDDCFGHSVAIDGDVVIVGSPQCDDRAGAAYVFRNADDSWTQEAKLTASDGSALDFFGLSVAVSDDAVLVGAPFSDDVARRDCGAGYLFRFDSTTKAWSEEAILNAEEPTIGCRLGSSVSLSGDLAALGAPSNGIGGTQQGNVLLFRYDSTLGAWIEGDPLAADGRAACGIAVCVSGDTVIAGSAPGSESDDVAIYKNQD